MSLIGTVIPVEGLRVRRGPGTEHEILGVLEKDERAVLLEQAGDWWRVECRFGAGFVHSAFVTVEAGEDATADGATGEESYTCVAGDTLTAIGVRFGVDFMQIAVLNALVEPFTIQIGQVLRIPRGGVRPVTTTTISLMNPFAIETEVTSSSLQGHHTPFLGACSCDLDVRGVSSPGTPVHFNLAGPDGFEMRGVVRAVGLACKSQLIADGGRTAKLSIQQRPAGSDWSDTGAWVLYAHLDPLAVGLGDVVMPGSRIGDLGPAGGGEYNSSCAQGSHVHMEAIGARCVVNQSAVIGKTPVMILES